jgi:hypothetical protein
MNKCRACATREKESGVVRTIVIAAPFGLLAVAAFMALSPA